MKKDISISIKLSKIDKSAFYEAKNGEKFLPIMLKLRIDESKLKQGKVEGEPDKYGYHGFIVQEIGKERKAAGELGPILGNCKIMDWDSPNPKMNGEEKSNGYSPQIVGNDDDSDTIPF